MRRIAWFNGRLHWCSEMIHVLNCVVGSVIVLPLYAEVLGYFVKCWKGIMDTRTARRWFL